MKMKMTDEIGALVLLSVIHAVIHFGTVAEPWNPRLTA
jgi:hypothetical protein